jgi:hypothetical protein
MLTPSSSAWDPKWLPAARLALLQNGYAPTPLMGKRPILNEWQNSCPTAEDIPAWEKRYPNATNTGLLTALTPAIDIDVLDEEVANILHNWVRKIIPVVCPELLRVGLPPKRAILFRCDAPFSKITTGKFVDEQGKEHQFEILCDGQQLATYGIHPDTKQPYTWPSARPGRTPRSSLPLLTPEIAQSLVNRAKALFQERGWPPKHEERKEPPKPKNFDRSDSEAHKIAIALGDRIESLCRELLPGGKVDGKNWAVGNINGEPGQSLKVCLVGEHRGLWLDFADEGWRGDALDLIEAVKNLKTIDAMDWSRSWLGWPQRDPPRELQKNTTPRQDTSKDHSWEDPDWSILDDRRGSLPEFPLRVLSPKAQELIKRAAKGAGVTPAHVAVPMIGIISSLIGIARRVEATSSWQQPMTCWTTVVGFSGTGKTPGLNVTKRCVKQVERNNKNSDDDKRRTYETKKESAAAAREKWKKAVKDAIENNVPAPPMPIEATDPGKFIPAKLYVSDGTIERLGELLQARPQGILFLRDELSGLFTNMSRYSSGQDNEFWLEAWNGDAFNVERMGRVTHVNHLLIGIAGGMQPDKLVKSFEGDHDGMYARVLFAWPAEPGCPVLSNDALEIEPDIQNAIGRVDKLAELTAEGALVIRNISLNAEAWSEFAQFLQFAHQGKDAFEGREREWWAKMTAHVLRLAGTLTYLPWAIEGGTEPAGIGKDTMLSAITLVRDYFWPHARACLRQIGLSERHTNARRVLRWLKANHKTEVSREDVRRDALAQRLDANETTELLTRLCNSGWLREKISPSGPQGGKPPRRWLVNPHLRKPTTAETAETAGTPHQG